MRRPEPGPADAAPGLSVVRIRRADAALLTTLEEYDFEAFGETGLRKYDLASLTVWAAESAEEGRRIVESLL